jgi:hypothetical protein
MNATVNTVNKRSAHTNVTSIAMSSSSAKGYMGISKSNPNSKISSDAKSSNFFKGSSVPSSNIYMSSSISRGSKITMSSMFGIGQSKAISNGIGRW